MASMTVAEKQTLIATVPYWFHSIDVGDGVVTKGRKSAGQLAAEWESFRVPDLRGKTVLDINCWDGWFAFRAEEAGAASVTALDHWIWSMDIPGLEAYIAECAAKNETPKLYNQTEFYKPNKMPGKVGFNLAYSLRNSAVYDLMADFMTMNLESLPKFDITFFLGSLYHMENPFESLKRLATVTRELAIIETEAIVGPGYEHHAMCEFFEGAELNNDVSNWWAPNHKALAGMCRAAGFKRVELLVKLSDLSAMYRGQRLRRFRAIAHAWK